ncbi:MAG TPA: hypothetical protein VFS63_15965 [Pseudolabrys sp.]|jgi:hypothetical protein|nr:hypothetical protein [Pseudolabrys sp.]
MRKLAIGLVAVMGITGAALTVPANAQSFGVYVGSGHHHRYHHHWRHGWRGAYAYDRRCRTIVRSHINRWGERVRVRKRVCY